MTDSRLQDCASAIEFAWTEALWVFGAEGGNSPWVKFVKVPQIITTAPAH